MPVRAAVPEAAAGVTSSYVSTRYSTDSGLPNPRAQKVLQTRDGYIWIGTESGLARFDGLSFKTFPAMQSRPRADHIITALYEDAEGTLWIGHTHGLTRYRSGRFEPVPELKQTVTAIAPGAQGRLWIACPIGNVWRYERGRFSRLAGNARVIFEDSRGVVWAGNRSGLNRIADDQFAAVRETSDVLQNVEALNEAPDGALWIGSAEGNFRLKDGVLTRWLPPEGEADEAAACFYTDRAGRFFLVSRRVYCLPEAGGGTPETLPVPDTDFPRTIVQDHEGSYWIGSRGDAVVRLRESAFRTFSRANSSLPDDAALTVAVDRQGAAWVGYSRNGVARIAANGEATPIDVGLPPGSEVGAIGFDSEDGMWLATRRSLYRWHRGKLHEYPEVRQVRAIYRDRRNTMWFGTQNAGVFSFRDGVFSRFDAPGGNAGLVFAESPRGDLFVGNRSTLARMEGGRLVEVPKVPDRRVRAIHFDTEGNLWLSTRDLGLSVFSGGQWFVPTAANQALLKLVTSINEDELGNFWFGSGRGICWVRRTNLLAEARGENAGAGLRFASQEDGVRPGYSAFGNYPFGAFGNSPITALGPDGRLWFAQRAGVVAVNPAALRLNRSPPPVRIEEVLVDNQPVDAATGRIVLPVGARRLTIRFAVLSFVQPARVLARYRLVGADDSWTSPGPGRSADYTGLPPGRYEFQVAACNSDGVWNQAGASLAFTVQPLYWQTVWFRLLVLAGLFAGGGLAVWRVTRVKLRRQSQQLELLAETQRAEAALRESEARYQLVVRGFGAALWDWNILTDEVFYAPRFREMLGYTAEEFPGVPASFFSVLHPDDRERVRHAVAAHLSPRHTPYDVEYRLRARSGEYRWFHATAESLRDAQGRPYRMAGSIMDITARKQADEREQRSNEQLRALSARLESLREEERTRIAREIHDHLGQLLTALKLDLRSLERKVVGVEPTPLRAGLQGKITLAQQLADETAASVQRIASELRPGVLDRLGLAAAIESETRAFQARTGLHCECSVPKEPLVLSQDDATAVFRIFQEVLTNIARHARASRVGVRLRCQEDGLMLEVKDDGVGLRPEDLASPKSLGLLGIRERAALLGGNVQFEGGPGNGTRVTVQVPLVKVASNAYATIGEKNSPR